MRALALFVALSLAGCGFQLRGAADVPFHTIYIPGATGGIALELKRQIQTGTNARIVDSAKSADAILQFVQENRQKEILSLTGTGRVGEYQLRYTVSFRVQDNKGGMFVPTSTIVLTRDITFNDTEVLAKESEEELLYRDMQNDMVQQIMRRLAAAKPATPAS